MDERGIEELLLMYKFVWNNQDKYSEPFRKELIVRLAENIKVVAVVEDKAGGKYGYLHNMILNLKHNKMAAIKQFMDRTSCGLAYSKHYVEWVLGEPGSKEPVE